ncbi:MAG: ABC transporter substrate-binding protein [Oscillospiraceae bacterium]|nr:ABC transporter substrate-binding protein [Oscillospiraceae bacterium]
MGPFSKTLSCFAAILLVSSFASCGSSPSGGSPSSGTRVVTDVWGREVEIPAEVSSIVCLGSGAPRMAAYLEAVDMLAGVEEHDAEAVTVLRDYSPVYQSQIKELPVVGAGGGSGANNGYPEELIKAMPDVILAGFSAEAADELAAQTAIPVVSVRYLSINFVDESFYSAMRVFAEVIGKEERCEEVLSYIDGCKADLAGRTADVPDAEKKKAYTGAVTFSGRHGFSGTYANFGPLIGIHALNVADELAGQNYFEADLEKVLEWDPDVIFLDPGNMDLVNDEYRANTAYFDSLRAVSEKQVYTMPSFNNCGTNITYALMDAYYAGTVLFPEQFSDIDIAAKSGEILMELLGKDIFDEMAAGGLYYGPLAFGE